MSTYTYFADQELPSIALDWSDRDGTLIDFSSGYTFSAKVCTASTATIVLTKSSGITGAATSPNITIDWSTSDFSGLTAAVTGTPYDVWVYAHRTADSKDRVFGAPIRLLLKTAPA